MTVEQWLLLVPLALPAFTALLFGLWLIAPMRRSESAFSRLTAFAFLCSIASVGTLAVLMLRSGQYEVVAHIGSWFYLGSYHFDWWFVADRLSLPFAMFSAVLVGVIGAFSRRYLHRETGFFRFYFSLVLFGTGVELVVLAGSLDLLFIGWEIVGLTSALLIAYFLERRNPVEHGVRAFMTYRFCDIGLLSATVWLHHVVGSTHVNHEGAYPWDGLPVPDDATNATVLAVLLIWASMGKSAQVPFGGWLPRAMEGPTSSSAIFYGAISIHLGPYLLLRAAPILEASAVATGIVVVVGAVTAMHATFVGRVQTDIKSALAYASMTQVGIIFIEIGLGFRFLALAHIVGHAALRSLQILRSPSLLHDHHHLEQAMGGALPRTGGHLARWVPKAWQPWLYRHALERGYFDAILQDWVVGSFVRSIRRLDAFDQRWTAWLAGETNDSNSKGLS